ncbi:MAG: 2-phospho-L-lactate/phosphoenolpyruvate guanylyltransferase [Thermoleophilaceae bacterium]|nr:2-phospho-L-lactate/phosphoenolpyruvate guanylyltransferase [Thermoleophilaceae bacterium]
MRTIAILPMKRFTEAKSRLSTGIGGGARQALAQAMFADVLASLRRVQGLDAVAVVTSDHEVEAALIGEPVTLLPDEERAGQSAATLVGVRHALVAGFERVLLVPGDAPLMDAAVIDDLLLRSQADSLDLVIVPDRHRTGTNALLISPPGAFEPSFGPGSLERHTSAARSGGLTFRVDEIESLMLDVDTPEDLDALIGVLESERRVAPRTRGSILQLGRMEGSGLAAAAGRIRDAVTGGPRTP